MSHHLGNSNIVLSRFILGTWLTVGDLITCKQLSSIVSLANEYGINCIDTADSYGFGETEIALGKILKKHPKENFKILTKLYFSTNPDHNKPNGLSWKSIHKCTDDSLRRLGIECIDLQQAHRFDPQTPIEETVSAMEELVKLGKIRYWGVSKWNNSSIENAKKYGATHLVSRQELFNLFHQNSLLEHQNLTCKDAVGFLAYSPLARGVLTGKYNFAIPINSRALSKKHGHTVYDLTYNKLKMVSLLSNLSESLNISISQLVLAYYLHKKSISSIIIGVSQISQLINNINSLNIILPEETIIAIDNIFYPTFS
jgi:aryl-alcohol dehydrogenase-like predicted oxidoreductase